MDAWMGGLAIDGKSREDVVSALDAIYTEAEFTIAKGKGPELQGDERALIISGSRGWTAVYLERFEQDEAVAAALSKTLDTVVLAHRAELYEAFQLLTFLDGECVDHYRSSHADDPALDDYGLEDDGLEDDGLEDDGLEDDGLEDAFQDDSILQADDPDFGPDFRGANQSDPNRIAALVPRIDAIALAEVFERCRTKPGGIPPRESTIAKALKDLRKILGLGTLEHDFIGLWHEAERLDLKAQFRAYKAPKKGLRDVWESWRFKAARSREAVLAPARQVRDRLRALRPETPEPEAEPEPEEKTAPEVETRRPKPKNEPKAKEDLGPGLRAEPDESDEAETGSDDAS